MEELGIKCTGDVWVAVTSQEAIDEVTAVKTGDFSKIQGRFNTRLSFSSASVDEVIQKRILAKKPEVEGILEAEYANKQAVLKNLFTFQDAGTEIRGYRDAKQFAADFPFVSYQFPMLQKALVAIRSHGSSGKSLSDGARSMLAGFQEAAQAVEDKNERALVPFWRFYDTLQAFLDGAVQTVIRTCEQSGEDDTTSIRPQDAQVLKTLFLIRYISDHIKNTPENISILMADDIDVDAFALRKNVQASLDRLHENHYIGKSGETYTFLTNEEQDVENEISAVSVDPQELVGTIGSILYEQLMPQKTLHYEGGQFPIAKYVDHTPFGKASEGLELRIVTDLADDFARSESQLLMQSQKPQCVIALGEGTGYVSLLIEEAKIRRYERTSNLKAQTSTRQEIVRRKVAESRELHNEAVEKLKRALSTATCYISGSKSKIQGANYERAIDAKLTELVGIVYPCFNHVEEHVRNDGDVGRILASPQQESFDMEASPNGRATGDVRDYLTTMGELGESLTVDSLKKHFSAAPYGWTALDVAGILAGLVARKDVVLKENGMVLDAKSREARTALTNEAAGRKVRVELRRKASEDVRRRAREALRGFYEALDDPTHVIPANDDDMADDAATYLEGLRDELLTLVREEYGKANYPGRAVVEETNRRITDILHYKDDPSLFFQTLADEAQALRSEALEVTDVRNFFPAQQRVYDSALEVRRAIIEQDAQALEQDPATAELVDTIVAILGDDAPYGRIPRLGTAANKLRRAHGEMVAQAREDVGRQVAIVVDQMREFAELKGVESDRVDATRLQLEQQLQAARSITQVKATIASANEAQRQFVDAVNRSEANSTLGNEAPTKTTRTLTRNELMGLATLSSESDVDALLSRIRARLMDELSQADVVQIY